MTATIRHFPPIYGIFPYGQWRGLCGTLIAWRNGGRCLVRFDHDGKVREVYRRSMQIFREPRKVRHAAAPRRPLMPTHDGAPNPMAA